MNVSMYSELIGVRILHKSALVNEMKTTEILVVGVFELTIRVCTVWNCRSVGQVQQSIMRGAWTCQGGRCSPPQQLVCH